MKGDIVAEKVREFYRRQGEERAFANAKPGSFVNIAFDAGVIAERKRIIKLIKEHIAQQIADDTDQDFLDYHEDICGLCKNFHGLGVAIALIKGDTSE